MKPAKPLKELIIVVIILIGITLFDAFAALFFGNSALDINLHDTYFVVQHTAVLSPFLWFVTLVYIIRTAINRYKNTLQNLILLTACLGLNILMLNYLKLAAKFDGFTLHNNWTIYPPLSALGKIPAPKNHESLYNNTTEIIFIIQILLLLLLVIIAVLTGKNWKTTKNVH